MPLGGVCKSVSYASLSGEQGPIFVRALGLSEHQFEIVVGTHRFTEQQALHVGAPEFLQEVQLTFFLELLLSQAEGTDTHRALFA